MNCLFGMNVYTLLHLLGGHYQIHFRVIPAPCNLGKALSRNSNGTHCL